MVLILPLVVALIPPQPPQADPTRIKELIEALGDPDYTTRTCAHQTLRGILPFAEKQLQNNLNHPDAEVRSRCRELLEVLAQQRLDRARRYSGKIALVDPKGNRIAADARRRDGVKAGDRLQVSRLGEKVGVLVVADVQVWGCWAVPEGDIDVESFRKGDGLELLPLSGR